MTDETFEELESADELDTIEELPAEADGEAEETPAKAKKEKAPARPKIEHGAAWLASYATEQLGRAIDAKTIRMALRRLKGEGKIPHEHGARYEFSGPEDATVLVVLEHLRTQATVKAAKAAAPKKVKTPKGEGDALPEGVEEDSDAPVEDLEDLTD